MIIQGATGSGKSTQVPQYVLDYCTEQSVYCNIAVTQPRKIGASSIARWISKERSWTLGGFVGYQVLKKIIIIIQIVFKNNKKKAKSTLSCFLVTSFFLSYLLIISNVLKKF